MKKIPRKELIEGISKLQELVGRAKTAYFNGSYPMRADNIVKPLEEALEEAFQLCVDLRSTD